MVLEGAGLRGVAVVPRNDSAESLFPLDLAFVGRRKIRNIDFGDSSPKSFEAPVASDKVGGTIDVRLDSPYGRLIGRINAGETGGLQTWKTVSCPVRSVTGIHDLYLVFGCLDDARFDVDWWQFK